MVNEAKGFLVVVNIEAQVLSHIVERDELLADLVKAGEGQALIGLELDKD